MEAKDLLPQQRFVSMQVDEMGIKAALELSRTRQKNTGQVDVGGLTGKEDESEGGKLANSMCNVLIKGITDALSVLLASYPVKGLDAITLRLIILNAIEVAEKAGFFVLRVVGDNAKVNEKLFELLRQPGDDPLTPWVVTHPFDPQRKLFLAYDATHIPGPDSHHQRKSHPYRRDTQTVRPAKSVQLTSSQKIELETRQTDKYGAYEGEACSPSLQS